MSRAVNQVTWGLNPEALTSVEFNSQLNFEDKHFFSSKRYAHDSNCLVYLETANEDSLQLWDLTNPQHPAYTTNHLIDDWLGRIKTLRNKQEHLNKAFGLHKQSLHILDTTAGLGKDSLTLAALGARVKMIEKNPMVALFVAKALEIGRKVPVLQNILRSIEIINDDSFFHDFSIYNGIYCDPMFEHKKNKSAKNKLPMQILQLISSSDTSEALYEHCVNQLIKGQRLVIKKSPHSKAIEQRLNFQLKGKAFRYDIYLG